MPHGTVYVLHKYVEVLRRNRISSQRYKLAHARCSCLNPNWTRELFFNAATIANDAWDSGDDLEQLCSGRQHGEIARGRTLLIVSAAGGYKYNPPKHHDQIETKETRIETDQMIKL